MCHRSINNILFVKVTLVVRSGTAYTEMLRISKLCEKIKQTMSKPENREVILFVSCAEEVLLQVTLKREMIPECNITEKCLPVGAM